MHADGDGQPLVTNVCGRHLQVQHVAGQLGMDFYIGLAGPAAGEITRMENSADVLFFDPSC